MKAHTRSEYFLARPGKAGMPCIAVQGLVIPFKALPDIIYFADVVPRCERLTKSGTATHEILAKLVHFFALCVTLSGTLLSHF